MLESAFQAKLIKTIREVLPGSIVIPNDGNYLQGFPDILVLYRSKWAALECKKNSNSKHQPNQDYYIDKMNDMSYAAFVYPENVEEILYELQHALAPRRKARIPKCFQV